MVPIKQKWGLSFAGKSPFHLTTEAVLMTKLQLSNFGADYRNSFTSGVLSRTQIIPLPRAIAANFLVCNIRCFKLQTKPVVLLIQEANPVCKT